MNTPISRWQTKKKWGPKLFLKARGTLLFGGLSHLIVVVFVGLILSWSAAVAPGQEAQQPIDTLRIDTNLISVPVIVSDRQGRYVPGLTVQDFKLYDNSVEQKISFFDAAEEPLNILLLLDTSQSTRGVLGDIKKAARNFLKELRPQDRAMVVSFDYEVQKLSPLTSDRKVLETAIKHAEVGRYIGTLLNDAVMETTAEVFQPITGRKAIILLTDGKDAGSRVRAAELISSASEADAMIYSIFYESSFPRRFGAGRPPFPGRRRGGIFGRRGPRFDPLPPQGPGANQRRERQQERNEMGAEFLSRLSEVTGGRFYSSKVTDLKKAFDLVAEELRHQYRLGFYPIKMKQDGSLHSLKVRVDVADVAIRSRYQYRAKRTE
jgi:VWFA-related protein